MKKLLLLAALSLALSACSKSDPAEEAARAAEKAAEAAEKAAEAAARAAGKARPGSPEAAAEDMAKAAEGLGKAMGEMGAALAKAQGNTVGVKPVSFKELKARLPDEVGDLKRTSAKGSSAGKMGFNVAQAEARYGDGKASAEISLVDPGGFQGFVAMAAVWANVEIEEESDNGYKKTLLIDGYKAMEEWDARQERGKLNVIVADRFVIEVKGRGVPMKDLKKALKEIDLDDLKALAEKSVAAK